MSPVAWLIWVYLSGQVRVCALNKDEYKLLDVMVPVQTCRSVSLIFNSSYMCMYMYGGKYRITVKLISLVRSAAGVLDLKLVCIAKSVTA